MKKIMLATVLAAANGYWCPAARAGETAGDSGVQNAVPQDSHSGESAQLPNRQARPDAALPQAQGNVSSPPGSVAAPAAPPAAPVAGAAEHVAAIPVNDTAQDKPQPASSSSIEEVIVSARRVAESMQQVPVAISAMSAEDMQREHIKTSQDLQGRVPSLVIGNNSQMRNTETPTIRGQGAQFGTSPGVVIYFAEVPLPSDLVLNNQGGPGKFFDLSDIQVLKGSQGTLFGRNTTGGALLLEPHKPERHFSASLRTDTSSYWGQTYEGVINMPLADRTLLVRAGAQYLDRDGFTHDVVTGKDYDDKHFWTTRLGITWRPLEEVDNYFLGYYTDSSDNGTANVIEDINRTGLNQAIPGAIGLGVLSQIPGLDLTQVANIGCVLLDTFGPSSNCGQDILDEQHARGHRRVQLSANPTDTLRTGGLIDNFSYSLTDELTLRNIASYSSFWHQYRWDQDGSRASFDDFNNPDNVPTADLHTITEELQLQGTALDTYLKFAVGGYYETTQASGTIMATALFVEKILQHYNQTKDSYAPFAQGTYDFAGLSDSLSGLSLTLGARYTVDKTSGAATLQQSVLGLVNTVNDSHVAQVDSSAPTWTAGLDYNFDTTLVYGKVSRGYKTGGLSVVAVNPAHFTYKPEYVTNYEVGQKSDFKIGSMPARVNSALYYTNYADLQKTGIDSYIPPNQVTVLAQNGASVYNVGRATLYGFEFEGTLQPFNRFSLVATYGYTYAKYNEFSLVYGGATPQIACNGLVQRGQVAQLSCEPYQSAPRNQYSVSARYALPLDASVGAIEAAATYSWVDSVYSGQTTLPAGEPGAWLPSYGLINASLSWFNIFGSTFDAELYGTNLADKEYRLSNSNQWNLTYFRSSIYSEPCMVGLQLGFKWGD